MEYLCKYCGRAFAKKYNCTRHECKCECNPIRIAETENLTFECRYCHKLCKNNNVLRNHERMCPCNESRVYISHTVGLSPWNKGLTKKTDMRLKKQGETYSSRVKAGIIKLAMSGKQHTDETKQKMSASHKNQWSNGKSIFATAREHRRSYPEEYFASIFLNAQQNYHVLRYFLDFAWPDKKIYVEVDGEQHYTKTGIQHDKERTDNLIDAGWICVARVRWKEFKKMSPDSKRMFVDNILHDINEFK